MDAETQARIGLKMETPAAMEWQPEIHATGRVVDPLAFTAAAADYETARAAAISSQSELSRTQKLAEQNNASARVLEAATAAAARDALALKSAQAKFTADWGRQLAAQTNLTTFAEKLQTGDVTFVKLSLPAGMFPEVLPATATVSAFGNETNFVPADLADNLAIDAPTQMQSLLFSSRQKLSPGVAVTARLKMAGAPLSGVLIPASAVVQHDGKAWAYVQTQTNQFTRVEVPQDRGVAEGWFVQENFSATSRVVAGGAQTLLSAEFSTGEGAHEH